MIIPGLPLVVPKKSYSPVEGFETYPLNSVPSKFSWSSYGDGYYNVTNNTTTIIINNISKNYVTSALWGTGGTVGCLRIDSYFQKSFIDQISIQV